MATLEKIRSKSVLLFTVIILALLAFILGDFLTSGRSLLSNPTTVAEVNGTEIDHSELGRRTEELQNNPQNQGINGQEAQKNALEGMINEILIDEEIEKLGITVTKLELVNILRGKNAIPYAQQRAAEIALGYFGIQIQATPDKSASDILCEFLANPALIQLQANDERIIGAKEAWMQFESEISKSLAQQKYIALFTGTLTANALDAQDLYDSQATSTKIRFVKKNFSDINPDEFEITDSELSALYQQHKNEFLISETPMIAVDFISQDIVPLQADLDSARAETDRIIAGLQNEAGISSLTSNYNFNTVSNKTTKEDITDISLKNRIDTLQPNQVLELPYAGNGHKIAKFIAKSNEPVSVNFEQLIIEGDAKMRDSVLTMLNAGTPADTLIARGYALVKPNGDATDMALFNPEQPVGEQEKAILTSAEIGKFFAPDTTSTAQIYGIIRVNSVTNGDVYEYAVGVYDVKASAQSISKYETDLSRFVGDNNTADKFAENAINAQYTVYTDYLTPGSLALSINNSYRPEMLANTLDGVIWAMDAEKGQVSQAFKSDDARVYAVAVRDIYEGEYKPMSDPDVNARLREIAIRDKQAERIIADINGKTTIDDVANAFGVPADTAEVTFGKQFTYGIGLDPIISGRVAAAEPGKFVGPVKGEASVICFEVISQDKSDVVYDEATYTEEFNGRFGGSTIFNAGIIGILRDKADIEYDIHKFYRQ